MDQSLDHSWVCLCFTQKLCSFVCGLVSRVHSHLFFYNYGEGAEVMTRGERRERQVSSSLYLTWLYMLYCYHGWEIGTKLFMFM